MRLHFGNTGSVGEVGGAGTAAAITGARGTGRVGAEPGAAAGLPGSDRTYLSATSGMVYRSQTERAARIQELSAAVNSGTYQISPAVLSRSIVHSMFA